MKQVEIFILGCGKTARELIRRLDHHWKVTVIDLVPELFEKVGPRPNVTFVQGDGTSEMILRRAGAERAQYAVACSTDDEANTAFCTLMRRRFDTARIVALGASEEAVRALSDIGVVTINRAAACAALMRNRIETGIAEAIGVGAGQGELLEVILHESSYYAGLTLGDLPTRDFRVAAVYRGENLLLPDSEVVLMPGDRVLLIGNPGVLRGVAEAFLSGDLQFPRQYGERVLVPVFPFLLPSQSTLEEAVHLVRSSRASGIDAVPFVEGDRDEELTRPVVERLEALCEAGDIGLHVSDPRRNPLQTLSELTNGRKVGIVVLPPEPISVYKRIFGISFTSSVVNSVHSPVLIARASFPYRSLVVPCVSVAESRRALEIAVDVSRMVEEGARVIALRVHNRLFPQRRGGDGGPSKLELFLLELAKLHRKEVEVSRAEGNPIVVTVERSEPRSSLVMIETCRIEPHTILNPDVVFHIAHRARSSVLILPREIELVD